MPFFNFEYILTLKKEIDRCVSGLVTVESQQTHCLFANLKISISSYRLPHLRTPGHVITRNRTPIQPLCHYGHRRRVQL